MSFATNAVPVVRQRPARVPMSRAAALLLLGLGALITVLPFYFMFVFATHSRSEIFNLPPPTWFGDNSAANYTNLLGKVPFWRNLWNSQHRYIY